MLKALLDSIRYLYDDPSVSYIQLMVTSQKAEAEFMDKAGIATGKAGVVNNNHSEKIQALSKQIYILMSMVKGNQGDRGKSKCQGHSNWNKLAKASGNGEVNEQANRNAYHSNNQTYPKPPSTAAGLFRGRQKPVQCY